MTNFRHPMLSLPRAGTMLYRDVCPRVSTCVFCEQPIPKGSDRIVFYAALRGEAYSLGTTITGKNRGKIFRERKFIHPHCIATWATNGLNSNYTHGDERYCFDCAFPLQVVDARAYLHKRGSNVYLCKSCATSPRWRYCRYCGQYVKRYSASEVKDPLVPAGHFCCDYCQAENDVVTIKSIKRDKRERKNARTSN